MSDELIGGLGWFAVNISMMLDDSISREAKAVFLNFSAHVNNKNKNCFPSCATQSKETGFGIRAVEKARKELETMGFVQKNRIFGENGKFVRWQWTITIPSDYLANKTDPSKTDASVFRAVGLTDRRQNEGLTTRNVKQQEVKQEETNLASPTANAGNPEKSEEKKLRSSEIVRVIDAFRESKLWIAPNYGNISERRAAEALNRELGDSLPNAIKAALAAKTDRFSGKVGMITTPSSMLRELTNLRAWAGKKSLSRLVVNL